MMEPWWPMEAYSSRTLFWKIGGVKEDSAVAYVKYLRMLVGIGRQEIYVCWSALNRHRSLSLPRMGETLVYLITGKLRVYKYWGHGLVDRIPTISQP